MAMIDSQATTSIVAEFDGKAEMLVQILAAIVARYGWIPAATIRQLAEELNLSRAEVHGVVEYYHDFRTREPGHHIVKICQAEACQAMGSTALTKYAEKSLHTSLGGTTKDFSLEAVYCLGNCACSPAVMINGKTFGRVDEKRFEVLVNDLRGGE